MSEQRTKSNKKFMLLSAIGIFMVVDSHTFTALNFFGDIIPYNSFFMPMFVFISGYFNKVDSSTNLWAYFKKKVKTLLVPYVGISLAVFCLQQLINLYKLGSDMPAIPAGYLEFVLDRVVTEGAPFPLLTPMWFVITLFAALMVYAILKKFLGKFWNSIVMFVIFCGLNMLVVYLAKNIDPEALHPFLLPLKVLFFLPFLELGRIYKNHIEGKHEAIPGGAKIGLMFGMLVVNVIRTSYMTNAYDVASDSLDDLSRFISPYIVTPLISAFVGITFWLTFVDLIGKQVGESRFVNFMSCNTFWIMGFHILFFNILNCLLMTISLHIVELPYFDVESFKQTEWYFWEISSNIKVLYVLAGVLGPLAFKWIFEKISAPVKKLFSSLPEKSKRILSIVWYVIVGVLIVWLLVVLIKSKINTAEPETLDEYEYEIEDNDTQSVSEDGDQPIIDNRQDDKTDDTVLSDPSSIPAYALVDLIYEQNGEAQDYYTELEEVYCDGKYTVTIKRSDDRELPAVFDGLSYMAIKLLGQLGDDKTVMDISNTEIKDISVMCDGVTVTVVDNGTVSLNDTDRYIYFDCYATEDKTETFDFKNANEIVVSYTLYGIIG
ncbi:MAG: acyltransferase [Lachnospiraceae bacterium]|nr:acyltransferase [Lachnospiraceae bacterium]